MNFDFDDGGIDDALLLQALEQVETRIAKGKDPKEKPKKKKTKKRPRSQTTTPTQDDAWVPTSDTSSRVWVPDVQDVYTKGEWVRKPPNKPTRPAPPALTPRLKTILSDIRKGFERIYKLQSGKCEVAPAQSPYRPPTGRETVRIKPTVRLKVDIHERMLIPFLVRLPYVDVETLDVGDFQFWINDKLVYLIERKTKADLSACIQSGAYRQQTARMTNLQLPNWQMAFLLEDCAKNKRIKPASVFLSCATNKCMREQIGWIETSNHLDTVRYLLRLLESIIQYGSRYFTSLSSEGASVAQGTGNEPKELQDDDPNKLACMNTARSKPSEYRTDAGSNILALESVVGLGRDVARAIYKTIGNVGALAAAYAKLKTVRERHMMLAEVRASDASDDPNAEQTQRLGPVVSTRIYQQLFCLDPTEVLEPKPKKRRKFKKAEKE